MSYIGKDVAPQPQGTYSQSEIDTQMLTKVPKVASTDNAVVRFDGTTGQVQNSGVTIDDSGNVGIGTTPSAWRSTYKGIQTGSSGAFIGDQYNTTYILANGYDDGSWKYRESREAGMYAIDNNTHYWKIAPSGTAGNAITWTTAMTLDNSGNLKFNSGYGSAATAYGCRAWVNFNGTGTVAIRASGNVSSITDNGVGDYTVNFTTAMVDANYATVTNKQLNTGAGTDTSFTGLRNIYGTTSSVTVFCRVATGAEIDPVLFAVSVFR